MMLCDSCTAKRQRDLDPRSEQHSAEPYDEIDKLVPTARECMFSQRLALGAK